jgi:C4-dicarboxylate-specific signal transduction histidine kinase
LHVDLMPDLPAVHGNRIELQQVLINLVMNAFQAADAGAAGRQLDLRSSMENGRVQVSVRDYGPGILEADCTRLFMPFFSTKEEGMGLGLSICRSIIGQHAGNIDARPAAPGVTFTFDLPAMAAHQAA